MKNPLILIAVVLISIPALSQERSKFLYAEFADKSVTLWPFYKPFGGNFDPAITLGAGIDYKQKGNIALFQTLQLSGFTTDIMGQGYNLTTSIGYRFGHTSGVFAEATLGLGAALMFPVRKTYSLNEDGSYVPALPPKLMSSVPVDLLLGYSTGMFSLYLKYRYMIQGPYVNALPVLPSSLTGIGIRYNISSSEK